VSELLSVLNPAQQLAAQTIDGPVLIVAGAGTGKTRTLMYRLAYLATEAHIAPENLLAITFTTKAAAEMQARAQTLCHRNIDLAKMWVGTIHALCYQILKKEGQALKLTSDFEIISPSDHAGIIRELVPQFFPQHSSFSVKEYALRLSLEKDQWAYTCQTDNILPFENLSPFCRAYQATLAREGMLDFDDLILKTLELMHKSPPVAERMRWQFSYISVDEYQDINHSQYQLIRKISGPHPNLCVVGDADQAIYAFRGAQLKNFVNFQNDFPGATVIKLEANYRCTKTILTAAQTVIEKNAQRIDKKLIPTRPVGANITICEMFDGQTEARFVAKEIERLVGGMRFETAGHYASDDEELEVKGFGDIAVLYRLHAQSRPLKRALQDLGIPIQLVTSLSLYEEPEVKLIINFLEVLHNNEHNIALCEILNSFVKGLGPKTIQDLRELASKHQITLIEELNEGYATPGFSKDKKASIANFLTFLNTLRVKSNTLPLDKLIEMVYENLFQCPTFQFEHKVTFPENNDNLFELMTAAAPFSHVPASQGIPLFLQKITTLKEGEFTTPDQEAVTLLTVHGAKGLEFPVIFITGLEEGLFPYDRENNDDAMEDPEEERRLFYVGITRAKEKLYLLRARNRFLFGERRHMRPSSFLKDIPDQTLSIYIDPKIKQKQQPKKPKQMRLFD
jgi:DNA helicase-2/ATP-dependent DNA helicase PcrA